MRIIKIYSDTSKGCIFFENSTVEPKFLGTIQAIVHPDQADRIIVYRLDRLQRDGVSFRSIFRRLWFKRVANRDGQLLHDELGYTRAQVVEYINGQASALQSISATRPEIGETLGFKLDDTSTTIMVNNGESFGINTLKASLGENGLIQITSTDFSDNAVVYFEEIDPSAIRVNEDTVSGGPQDVVNVLNELFTAGPFESVVISDPYSTMIADVGGIDTTWTNEGTTGIDPVGNDIYGNSASGYLAGLKTVDTIDQAGEYFTFDIRGLGQIGFGLVLSDDSFTNGLYSGSATYADPAGFATQNGAHFGYQFSHWFHQTPQGSWTNYGANTGYSMRSGWSNWDQKQDWVDGNPVKIRVGIDTNGFISIESKQDDGTYIVHVRTSYPVPQGVKFHLGIKMANSSARVYSTPKVHLLEPEAPTLYFRYIESPDGNYEYPLFATAEEANYVDKTERVRLGLSGEGTSHPHTYSDDPTGTTWYMPDNGSTMTATSEPYGQFIDGQFAEYTEITSLSNSDLAPPTYSHSNLTYQEGSSVLLQVTPAGATWSTSASISPSGSGLVFDGMSMIMGTLADVASDTVYTLTVTRGNSYGSTTGSSTITVTNVPAPTTNDTPWTKALDFSGSNERALQVTNQQYNVPMRMADKASTAENNADSTKTSSNGHARPWATTCVFKVDGHNSNQHIWNMGEGTAGDNIYLRLAANKQLYFGWGHDGSYGVNECRMPFLLDTNKWYGFYVASKGGRFNASNATAANLAEAFDIRIMSSDDDFAAVGSNYSTVTNWTNGTTGWRTNRSITGDMTIGGRGANRSFHGKVASFVTTTLKWNNTIPSDAEIKLMIADPIKWKVDYKDGKSFRYAADQYTYSSNFTGTMNAARWSTQIWLMGDGTNDSYSNMIRNQVDPTDQNWTKLNMISMVSNDIQNVSIDGLT